MSGPISATFGLDAGLAFVASEAIRGALVIAEGYAAEEARQAETREMRESERHQRRELGVAGRRAVSEEIAREEARLRRLVSAQAFLAAQLGEPAPAAAAIAARPADGDAFAQAAYLRTVRTALDEANATVAVLSRRSAQTLPAADLSAIIAAAPTVAQQLAAFEAKARLAGQLGADVAAQRRIDTERILARAVIAEGAVLPDELESLAAEMIATLSTERAEALATELRLRVARHNGTALAEAATRVLEQSLRDLGYEVEGIGETLFVEGGVAHFQKAGWSDYFVRLRVDAERDTLNFNVVRAGAAGEDRKREDMLAEERWCAEFPRLQETLALRGIRVDVTRMLGAGELPVQVVDRDTLPELGGEEEKARPADRTMQKP
jgi:hypothetical protein